MPLVSQSSRRFFILLRASLASFSSKKSSGSCCSSISRGNDSSEMVLIRAVLEVNSVDSGSARCDALLDWPNRSDSSLPSSLVDPPIVSGKWRETRFNRSRRGTVVGSPLRFRGIFSEGGAFVKRGETLRFQLVIGFRPIFEIYRLAF